MTPVSIMRRREAAICPRGGSDRTLRYCHSAITHSGVAAWIRSSSPTASTDRTRWPSGSALDSSRWSWWERWRRTRWFDRHSPQPSWTRSRERSRLRLPGSDGCGSPGVRRSTGRCSPGSSGCGRVAGRLGGSSRPSRGRTGRLTAARAIGHGCSSCLASAGHHRAHRPPIVERAIRMRRRRGEIRPMVERAVQVRQRYPRRQPTRTERSFAR